MNIDLLQKYLNNTCNEAEVKEVIRWIKTDVPGEESRNWLQEDWNSFPGFGSHAGFDESDLVFDRIREKINHNLQPISIQSNRKTRLKAAINLAVRVAAILLLPTLIFLFQTLSERNRALKDLSSLATDSIEVIAPQGSRTVVKLSDGSTVHLNYGSKIKYPHVFRGSSRGVSLSGEGLFEVEHNPAMPFVVRAKDLNIKALGTIFNVLAYEDDDQIEATLVEGKVGIDRMAGHGREIPVSNMKPNQHLTYKIPSHEFSVKEGKIEKYISWTEGKLIFEDTPILQVTEKLSRIYNVDFEVREDAREYVYTVTFSSENLFQILDLMTMATPVKYKVLQRRKLDDGTFSKQIIIIEKRKRDYSKPG